MNLEVRADTDLLRFHTEYLLEERKLALELVDRLKRAQTLAGDTAYSQFLPLINEADDLADHFSSLRDVLETTGSLFDNASREILAILEDQIALNLMIDRSHE